ncbi:hypothetical protein ACWDE0_24225 [Streptomyces sp. 900105755]
MSLTPWPIGLAVPSNAVRQPGATPGVAVLGRACPDGSAVTACAVAVGPAALCWATSRRM